MILSRTQVGAVLREALASARSQTVASIITILMVAGMIIAVMLTTGRTVAAEQSVLSTIDSAGTRSIVIRAEDGAGITSDAVARIFGVEGVQWAAGFSSAIDSTNSLVADGLRVPARHLYAQDLTPLGIPKLSPLPNALGYASPSALEQLGLLDVAGSITLTTGASYAIAGSLVTPEYLNDLEPLILIPEVDTTGAETINLIVVTADRPDLVGPVAEAVLSLLAPSDATKITVQTSEALAQLRALLQGELGSFSRGLVLVIVGLTGVLVAITLFGLVMLRRKDFGRRRALGATRSLIVGLLLTQTVMLASAGAIGGIVVSVFALLALGDPLPGPAFMTAIGIVAVSTATAAALPPALMASRRDPLRELRVP